MKRKLVMVLLVVFLVGCAANKYVVHPGALNRTDSVAADTLVAVQSAIEVARDQIKSGALKTNPAISSALVELEKSYNIAEPAYKTWRNAVSISQPSDALYKALQEDLVQLTTALTTFRKAH